MKSDNNTKGRVLVTGWFSFEQMGATAGDLLVCDVACRWLQKANRGYDVALAPPFEGGVDWRKVDPGRYSELIFACGPYHYCEPISDLFGRFGHTRILGLNLSMLANIDGCDPDPFHRLWERDSNRTSRPDMAFLAPREPTPVAGLVLVKPQNEYGKRGRHTEAKEAFRRLAAARELAIVPVDTRLDENATGLRTPGEIEALIAKMDVVLTTRLHGTVFALRNGVPPLVIDPIAGGAKVIRHARTVGWPVALSADQIDDRRLEEALRYCLTDDAREKAAACSAHARHLLEDLHREFLEELESATTSEMAP